MLQLVWRGRQGAESRSVCPVWAGRSLNITESYFFRIKSNRGWASGHGLLPKNIVPELLSNVSISLSNRNRIQVWKLWRYWLFGAQAENWTISVDERGFSEDQSGSQDGVGFRFLTCSPRSRCWLSANPVYLQTDGSFCHLDWPHPHFHPVIKEQVLHIFSSVEFWEF